MSREDLLLPRSARTTRRRTSTRIPSGGGAFAALVGRQASSGGGGSDTAERNLSSERNKVRRQGTQLRNSRAPGSFKQLVSEVESGEREKADEGGIMGAIGDFVSDVPIVGAVQHKIGDALASQPVQAALRTIDIPRAAVVSGLQELVEAADSKYENDESFNEQFNRRMGFREMAEKSADSWMPDWLITTAGLAGDVVLDPTTYIGVGAVKTLAKEGAEVGAEQAVRAAVAGGRRELSEQIVTRAGQEGLDTATREAAERLAAEAGQRGRGALTTRGLQRAGVTAEEAEKLGVNQTFGVQLRAPGMRQNLGGRRLVEAVEDMKGAIKARTGRSAGGRLIRQTRYSDYDAALVDVLYSGKGDIKHRANAARILAATHIGRGESAALVDRMSRWARQEMRPLLKRKDVDWAEVFDEIETGKIVSTEAKTVHEFFEAMADSAEAAGIQFDRRMNYVPHRPTAEARQFIGNPAAAKAKGVDVSKLLERFENPRSLQVGDTWLGETVKTASIKELNEISTRKVGFDFFETNPDQLIAKTLGEAGDAAERATRGRALAAMGAPVDEIERVTKEIIDFDPKTAERLKNLASLEKQARRKEALALRQSVRQRQYAVSAGIRASKARGKKLANELDKTEEAIRRADAELGNITVQRGLAEDALDSAKTAYSQATARLTTVAKQQRQTAMRRVDQLKDEVGRREARVAELKGKHEQLTVDLAHAEELMAEGVIRHMDEARLVAQAAGRRVSQRGLETRAAKAVAQSDVGEAVTAARKASEAAEGPLRRAEGTLEKRQGELAKQRGVVQETAVPKRATAERKAVETLRNDIEKMDQEAAALQVESMEANDLIPGLRARADILEDAIQAAEPGVAKAKASRWNLKSKTERAIANELAYNARLVSEILETEGMDKITYKMAQYEAKALAHEMDALRFGDEAAMRSDIISKLKQDNTRQVTVREMKKGFKDIGGGWQTMDEDLATQLKTVVSIFEDPKASRMVVKGWDAWNKWFRTWAVTSPGFVLRNLQGGWLNNLVAGVRMGDYKLFKQHMRVYASGPGWEERFINNFGTKELQRFRGALDAIAGTGWGQSAQEAGIGLFGRHGAKRAFDKTLGTQNPLSVGVRRVNEDAESLMRGAHAYMVFRTNPEVMGGAFPVNDAINSVAKYHFNYRDISTFDRWAKRAIPFWTFMSRNLPLQVENMVKHADVFNRTYGNLQRNLESAAGGNDDEIVPSYFKDLGGINVGDVPGLGRPGDNEYLMLDLPFIRLQEDIEKFSDVERILADVNPALKVPMELKAKEQFFSGIPLSETRMEELPPIAKVPGINQLLEQVGWIEREDGRQVISDAHAYALDALNPLASRATRVFPTAQKLPGEPGREREQAYLGDKQKEALLSILGGIGLRTNAPERQQGEMLRRSRELAKLLDQAKQEGWIGGG
jgi:hypothetical protein